MRNEPHTTAAHCRIVCFGELLMRLSPPGNELPLQSPRFDARFGGAEANVAASLAILGHDSVMVSALPDNVLGHACAGELRRHGVDTRNLHVAAGRMGLYFLSPGAMHRPSEVLYDRSDSVFARAPASTYDWPRLLAGAQWLHVSGINLALGESTAQAALDAVRAAREAGLSISFDCNYRSKLWGSRVSQAPALLREIVSEADLMFGNDRDVALMLDTDFPAPEAAERFRAAADAAFAQWPRLRRLAATERFHRNVDDQDIAGFLATRERVLTSTTYTLTDIVDRIGGGDAFAAGLLHGLFLNMPEQAALDFAMAATCLKHSIPGDVNTMREADMLAFLTQSGFEVKR
ncbi:sugar kinase [Dyella psychrodurans]|uniref:Sugar kinase n=1 Tax=Dyella psychrodurans TaxID=1927960 RepID=A0A370XAH5_9GAMM|nr:sugar kinase [Dyella psychrodurans]RDS85277.1 sugar kinase [Dyella psychrodurans]